jgi:hypothetical protein
MNIPQTQAFAKPDAMRPGAQLADKSSGDRVSRLAAFSLALMLLPFAGRLRRMGRRLGRMISIPMLIIASMAALAGITACGSASSAPAAQTSTYTVTITATSGAYSQSATVVLLVQ